MKEATVLSLGAGVQSSAMLLMALDGLFGEKPDFAVFADPGWEPKSVYEWLNKLEAEVHPFPIHRVSAGNIRTDTINGGLRKTRFATMPFYLSGGGIGRRQCTSEYKILPMYRHLRSLGITKAEMWIGISTDEAIRMKPSRVKWVANRWPLIEAMMNRQRCEEFLVDRMGEVAPKSSCIGCPFHSDAYWIKMREDSPDEFVDAVEFDSAIRVVNRMENQQFMHRSLKPLGQVAFKHEGQGAMFIDAFGNECEGICGT